MKILGTNNHPEAQVLGINPGKQGEVAQNSLLIWGKWLEAVEKAPEEKASPKAKSKAKAKVEPSQGDTGTLL